MRKNFLILVFLLSSCSATAQNSDLVLKPTIHELLTFSPEDEKLIIRRDTLLNRKTLSKSEQYELDQILLKYDETYSDIWQADGGGCSWYCAAGDFNITASSYLEAEKSKNYAPENIHDLSYKTAWAEGAKGYGIGEYVEYNFKPGHPRITEIRIANGYVKSEKAWFQNSRVKQLKMYLNGKPYAVLELNDTKALQMYTLPQPIGRFKDPEGWVLKFEIVDVYKGDKYDDTVISELFFDGIDDH